MRPTARPTLAEITKRVDQLVVMYKIPIKGIVESLTPEGAFVGALFDASDTDAMAILRELGFEVTPPTSAMVMDVMERPLHEAMRRHHYWQLDEISWEPETFLFYVFTKRAVTVRRFESGDGPELREVRRARDVEFKTKVPLFGTTAREIILQRCGAALKELWDPMGNRVALVERARHGAKVRYVTRKVAIEGLRSPVKETPPDFREAFLRMADAIEAGPRPGTIECVFQGWGSAELLWLAERSFTAIGPDSFTDRDEEVLIELIVACRDRKRALGLLKNLRETMVPSSITPLLVELIALVRDDWDDFDAIVEKAELLMNAAVRESVFDKGFRLRAALLALVHATGDRKRGGPINGRGGDA